MKTLEEKNLCIGRITNDGKIELFTGIRTPGIPRHTNPQIYRDLGDAIQDLDNLNNYKPSGPWDIYCMKIQRLEMKEREEIAMKNAARLTSTGNFGLKENNQKKTVNS